MDILFGTTSILCLTAISLERLYAVRYPAKHFNLSSKPVYTIIAGTWVAGFLLAAARFSFHAEDLVAVKIYTVVILILAFILPLIFIIGSYVLIFQAASNLLQAANQENLSRELRVAKTISVIIGLFVICWMPFFIVNMLFIFGSTEVLLTHAGWIISVTKALHYSNSMMNFFVYAVRSPDFRNTFKALVFKCNTSAIQERWRSVSLGEKKISVIKDHTKRFINTTYRKSEMSTSTDGEMLFACSSPSIDIKLYDVPDTNHDTNNDSAH